MADNNPFANAFNPDRGGFTGFLGGLAGVPTQSERSGSATGQALSELAALKDQGLSPQQAVIKFLQTPSGQDFFTNAGPDGMKQLTDGLSAMQSPAPTMHNLPPGGQLYQQNNVTGQVAQVANNPQSFAPTKLGPGEQAFDRNGTPIASNTNPPPDPADVQSFKYFSQIAKLPQAEIERIATLKADPNSADKSTVASQAIDELVKNNGLDPRLGEALKAGAVHIQPVLGQYGQDTGARAVVDLTNPGQPSVRIIQPGNAVPNTPAAAAALPPAVPGANPASGAATGTLPAVKPDTSATVGNPSFGSKKDMALAAGPVSKILGAATKLSEAIDPRLIIEQGAQANDRQTLLGTLRSDLQAIGTIGGGLSSNKARIDGYVQNYLDEGFFTGSPHSQVQKLIRLHETATSNIADESKRAADVNQPNEVRKQAAETIAGWERVLQSMPEYKTLIQQEKDIRAGTAGAPTVSSGANALINAGGKAITEGKKQVSKVQEANPGLVPGGTPDIDSITDPKALAAIDPRGLDRAGKIKYLRKVDAFKRGAVSGK